jgi:hypothetical protein
LICINGGPSVRATCRSATRNSRWTWNGNAGDVAKLLGVVLGASSLRTLPWSGLSLLDGGMSYQDLIAATGIEHLG